MRMMLRLFVAFCVATVLAQGIILGMAAARGNLKQETFVKGLALLNGIDISGERLQKMLDEYRQEPIPRYEDVVSERARSNLDLQMREESLLRMQKDVREKLDALIATKTAFDRQLNEFYAMLDREKENLLTESLQEVKRTLEAIAPEQAKDQLLKLYKNGQKEEVIAILKAMPTDKTKKILGEFVGVEEAEQLNEMLTMILKGEPTAAMLDQARQNTVQQ